MKGLTFIKTQYIILLYNTNYQASVGPFDSIKFNLFHSQ